MWVDLKPGPMTALLLALVLVLALPGPDPGHRVHDFAQRALGGAAAGASGISRSDVEGATTAELAVVDGRIACQGMSDRRLRARAVQRMEDRQARREQRRVYARWSRRTSGACGSRSATDSTPLTDGSSGEIVEVDRAVESYRGDDAREATGLRNRSRGRFAVADRTDRSERSRRTPRAADEYTGALNRRQIALRYQDAVAARGHWRGGRAGRSGHRVRGR